MFTLYVYTMFVQLLLTGINERAVARFALPPRPKRTGLTAKRPGEIAVKGPIVVDEPEMLTPIALAGVGIAYQFARQVDGWLASGQLVQLLPEWTPAFPGFYVYYPSRKQMASPLRAFVDYLRVECGE